MKMFLRQLSCFLAIVVFTNFSAANVLEKPTKQRDISSSAMNPLIGTTFDYDYFAPEARRAPSRYQKSHPTTTERPFVRYWNNFIRNIRVPVPTITWNMTNPLVNLFNAGYTNVIDTPVGNYNHKNTKRKRSKNTRKHANTKAKHSKKHKHTHAYDDDEETYQADDYNGYAAPYTLDLNPNKIAYYYDASTGQYYKLQTQYVNSYTSPEQPQEQPLDGVEEEQEEQIDEEAAAAQIEPPTTEAALDGNENENAHASQEGEDEGLTGPEAVKDSGEVEIIPADVENFDDSDEVQTPVDQLVEPTKMSKAKNIKNVEELRNAISAYMLDDRFNRMRQQANTAERYKMLSNKVKPQPKQTFTHYILQQV